MFLSPAPLRLNFLLSLVLVLAPHRPAQVIAKLITPPASLDLIYPDAATVPLNSPITLGIMSDDADATIYSGLVRDVAITAATPNGTEMQVPLLLTTQDGSADVGGCKVYPGLKGTGMILLDQAGTYTFYWNISYGISTGDPKEINANFCGSEPFSYQSWVLNRTLAVGSGDINANTTNPNTSNTHTTAGPSSSAVGVGVVTKASALPSAPTGTVSDSNVEVNGASGWRQGGVGVNSITISIRAGLVALGVGVGVVYASL